MHRQAEAAVTDRSAEIPVTPAQADYLVPLLRNEIAELRARGDALILNTTSRSAGFNCHRDANSLEGLADLLDVEFPEGEE